jgi:Glycogen recognition site of AMP-activated protein kinase
VADRRQDPGPIVERALESLRQLPAADGHAVERIVAAAARTRGQDTSPNDDDLLPPLVEVPSRHRFRIMTATIGALAAALTGVAVWRVVHERRSGVPAPVTAAAADSLQSIIRPAVAPAANADAAPVLTQFVFDGAAKRVVLVGDFNNWDEHATPLVREPGSTLWSVTVPVARGRHIYAFLVDSVWTVDKRSPVARDPDFGVTGSVILVGRP